MSVLGIVVIIIASLILLFVIGSYIYKRIKNLPTGECAYCSFKGKTLLKRYHKAYPKKENTLSK